MSELTDLVLQRKLEGPAFCPACKRNDYKVVDTRTTLLGFWHQNLPDPNHVWETASCKSCGYGFTVEHKSGNTWITKDGVVMAGLPNCFEQYSYTCCHCGAAVRRRHTELDGKTPAKTLLSTLLEVNGVVRQYRTFYECDGCHSKIEVKNQ